MLNFKLQNPLKDSSLNRTPRAGPCFALPPLFDSLIARADPWFGWFIRTPKTEIKTFKHKQFLTKTFGGHTS